MLLFISFIYAFSIETVISPVLNLNYYPLVVENNFYFEDYYIKYNLFFELSLEILITFCICYSLIAIFNDKNVPIFQYHKWLIYFYLLFVIGVIQLFLFNFTEPQLILGFSWLNSYYVLISKLAILILTIVVSLIIKRKLDFFLQSNHFIEFPLVLGFSVLFMFLLLSSYDFIATYLTVEGLSLTLYVLAILLNQGIVSVESAIKYFSLGAISSGCLILGVSILFGLIGSVDFLAVKTFLGSQNSLYYNLEVTVSILLILFAFFFKISAFPCHVWVADVYEGIWSPITAFFAIVIKVCLVLVFIQLIFDVLFNILIIFQSLFLFTSLGSMVVGSFGAIKQIRIKRFFAYTSINQIGFILLGISSCSLMGLIASIMYLCLYIIMNLIFFSIFLRIEHAIIEKNIVYLSDLYGISSYSYETSIHFSITILSMAGLPPLGGFIGKLFIYFSAIEARLDFSLLFTLLISILSTYYYLNCIRYIFFEKRGEYKLYYFINDKNLTVFLRCCSFFLVFFPVLLPVCLNFFIKLGFSCAYPFICG